MLLLARRMYGVWVEASDGPVGKLCDFLFDDHTWSIRSLVLDAGGWLKSRRVTLPPDMIIHKNWADHRLIVAGLTREQVLGSPGVETHVPIGQPPNVEQATIVDWERYWISVQPHPWQVSEQDPHLRNTQEVAGYEIQATDGPIGHIADFVVDEQAWSIRFLVADTRRWWHGKQVLVTPDKIQAINWKERTAQLALPRQAVEQCPQVKASKPLGEAIELPGGPT